MTVPIATGYRRNYLTFEDASQVALEVYEVLSYSGVPYMLNNYPYRKYGSNEQAARGDGTLVIPNLTFEIRGNGDKLTVGRQIYRAMQFTASLLLETYNENNIFLYSYRIPVAYALGVNQIERLTDDTFRAEIEFITTTAYWERLDTPDDLIGVI